MDDGLSGDDPYQSARPLVVQDGNGSRAGVLHQVDGCGHVLVVLTVAAVADVVVASSPSPAPSCGLMLMAPVISRGGDDVDVDSGPGCQPARCGPIRPGFADYRLPDLAECNGLERVDVDPREGAVRLVADQGNRPGISRARRGPRSATVIPARPQARVPARDFHGRGFSAREGTLMGEGKLRSLGSGEPRRAGGRQAEMGQDGGLA